MRFFNLFTPACTEIMRKKSIDAALCERRKRPQNRTDATPCLSDVYNIGTRARRRTANIILSGRSFFHRVLQIRRDFLTTCTQKSTRGKKLQVDVALYGRSMVEMLGVLAVIGVLSVGAIAGYSKAMLKYKLNKQAEQISTLVNAGLRYAGQWNFSQITDATSYFIKLGEVPKEMIRKNTTNTIYDVFNTAIYFTYTINTLGQRYTQFFIRLDTTANDSYSLDICRNVVNVAKEFHGNLRTMSIVNSGSNAGDGLEGTDFYGDDYCTDSKLCLKNLTVEQIDEFCRFNLGKTIRPHLKLIWDE